MNNPVQEATNIILDLGRCNSTHSKYCPTYHAVMNFKNPTLPECDCHLKQQLKDACEELEQVRKFYRQMIELKLWLEKE